MRVKLCEYFFKVMSKNLLFLGLSAKECDCQKKSAIVKVRNAENIKRVWSSLIRDKKKLNVRVFFTRGNFKNSASISVARKFSEKRVFLRASKIWRGFGLRAFQIFGHKKASKPVSFNIEKSEKKNLCPFARLAPLVLADAGLPMNSEGRYTTSWSKRQQYPFVRLSRVNQQLHYYFPY